MRFPGKTLLSSVLLLALLPVPLFAGEPMGEKEFMERVIGSTEEQVSELMGAPEQVQENGEYLFWIYTAAVKDMLTGNIFPVTQLLFVDGRVSDVINSRHMPEEAPSADE